ncbi:hypothetical protein M405DRAFT_886455, partial [Rhizopogon salebrosus TDB-379]
MMLVLLTFFRFILCSFTFDCVARRSGEGIDTHHLSICRILLRFRTRISSRLNFSRFDDSWMTHAIRPSPIVFRLDSLSVYCIDITRSNVCFAITAF